MSHPNEEQSPMSAIATQSPSSSSRCVRASGRSLPRVGARLRETPDAPRQIELGTGRVLSGQEMQREKAIAATDFANAELRRRVATDRYLTAVAWICLEKGDVTHIDTLKIRLDRHLRTSSCLRKRGSQFWTKKWERQDVIVRRVWEQYVAQLRTEATRRLSGCAPDMGPSAADDLDRIAADHAAQLALTHGGA
jgi:hypothetical protein